MSMTRIHQQVSGGQHERWYELGIRCEQGARRAIWLFAVLALLASLAAAQSASQLNGNVTDPSGAAVSGAKITLTEAATGFQRTTTSNASGLYQFLEVPPGDYRLEATATGFAPVLASKITLLVKLPSTVNIKLQVAGGTTSVTVEGEAPMINRTDASLGNVVEGDQIAELPIADRNVTYLLSLQPGVAYFGIQTQEQQNSDTRSGAVNGVRSDQSNVTLDGIGVNDQNYGYAFDSVLNVPPDSVQEFRVTTANSNADSGYSSGAQVSLVTKSGTNSFHGSAYEYNRNTVFSANDPFLKAAQLGSGGPNTRPELLRNVFGATFGGPIKKNRLFFFANYEGRRDAQGTSTLRTVPSAALAHGVLMYQCQTASDCPGNTVTGSDGNPYTASAGNYALGVDPNPGSNQGKNQITEIDPGNAQNPIGQPFMQGPNPAVMAALQQYPASNSFTGGDGLNTLGYRFASPADSSYNTYIFRTDYHINSSGSESLFWRGQIQYSKIPGALQFPGQPPATLTLDDSKGSTVGLTSLITPNLINDLKWGWVRQAGKNGGNFAYPGVYLNGISNLYPSGNSQRSTIFFVPSNQFTDSLNWTHKNHTFEFGTDLFYIRNQRLGYQNSFSDVQTNAVYLNTAGISEPSNPSPLNPVNNKNPATGQYYPQVNANFAPNFDSAITILLGLFPEGDGIYNFAHNGSALPQGTAVSRRYAINDYEFYGQDVWRVNSRLTLTYGLRWVLEAPPYETNGLQVSPCVEAAGGGCTGQNIGDWFNHTAALAAVGQPANNAGEISFVPGGPVNHAPGLWNWDKKNFSPRIAMAWAPDTGDGWASKVLGKKDQLTVRAGYSIMYDHFGIPIVNSFDQHGSFGLASAIGNSAGSVTPQDAIRFTCLIPGSSGQSCLPPPCGSLTTPGCAFGPTPSGSFPFTPSNTNFAINWGLDQSLKTPYTHVFNFSLQRQLSSRSSVQIAYVGTVGRRLPMQVDLAMPTNLAASGTTYFQAATLMSKAVANGVNVTSMAPVPFFENLFPAWAGVNTQNALVSDGLNACGNAANGLPANPTATQNIYTLWNCYLHNETFALYLMDVPSTITHVPTPLPNSTFGPFTFYHDQFSSLYAWRNVGDSNYNALQVTYNVRLKNLQGQFNYTFGKALDEASAAERIGPYEGTGGTGNDLNGGGIVINSWSPLSLRGPSDFNAAHQVNANLVYQLPFGKGQLFAGGAGPLLNELIGGWHVSGIFRWTSGFPITVDNGPAWATNWNIEGDAMPNGPLPKTSTQKNLCVGPNPCTYVGPDMFPDPTAALAAFRPDWPGESGVRNNLTGDGMFNIDTGVSKNFSLGEARRIEFSWQAFNAFNSVRYDVRAAQPDLGYGATQFGAYTSTLTTPRFMQFALRFAF